MNPRVSIDAQVVDEKEHQALIVEKMLEALERELVEVVVDADDLDLDQRVVLEQLEHEFGVDEAAQVEDQIGNWYFQFFDLLCECAFNIAFEDLSKVTRLQLFESLHLHLVEVLRVVFAQVTHQVLVDDLVPDRGRSELAQLELDSVLIQNTLRCLLHADRSNVEDVWRAHVVNYVVRRQALQLLGL